MSQKPRLEILEYTETPLGILCLRRRELLSSPGTVITEVTLNNEFLMSSYNTESETALAKLALEWHGESELDVLIGGLGLGYTAEAALDRSAVARVEVVELLPQVISWLERDLFPLARALRDEPRFAVTEGDIFRRLAGPAEKQHDAILIDVDHNPDELLAPENREFYTEAGLRQAREHLTHGGVLAIWSSAENVAFARTLADVFVEVKIETIHWENELIDEEQRDDLFLARS